MDTRPASQTRRLTATLLALAALAGAPTAGQAMDLTQAYQEALAIDPVVAGALAQLNATREKVPQARAGLRPSLTGSATVNRQAVDTNLAPRREFTTQNYSVNLSYPLYRMQNVETFEQSKLQVAVGEAQLAQAQSDLIVRVAQAYFDVLAAQDSLATIRAQKTAITEQLASARRNFEVGTATITDQQEAQSRFDLSVAQELAAMNDLEVKRAALAQLVGKRVPDNLKVLKPGVALQPPEPARETEWTEGARQNNYTVQQARIAAEIARREIDKQRFGHRPTLDLISSLGMSKNAAVNFVGVSSVSAGVGVQLSVPIYNGGAVDARVREAAALRDSYGLSTGSHYISAASANATLVVGSAVAPGCIIAQNTHATDYRFLKLFNKATAPVPGTDTPVYTLAIPPKGEARIDAPFVGLRFTLGLGFAITAGMADLDTTAIGANEVIVNIARP